jgi:hypothetical protein
MTDITPADITVLAPAFYTGPNEPQWSTRYLRRSAARHNVPIAWYGTGEPYRGWLDVQLTRLLFAIEHVTTSHILYTDSSDAVFLAGLDEIAHKLRGAPRDLILMSVESDGQVCAGGWLAHRGMAVDALEWLSSWPFDGDESNPQVRWREAIEDGQIEVERDYERHVFQVADEPLKVYHRTLGVYNPRTESNPCVLHWAGGYTDPSTGKSALIEPVWKELGYDPTVLASI